MEERKLFFKSDFKLWELCEAGYSVPFRFRYYTNSPKLAWEVSFDGHEYVNCKLMEDGRLCVAFDDHKLGLGLLKVERRYYLTDEDYQTDICDEVIAPAAVVCWDGIDTDGVDMDGVDPYCVDTYNIRLSLEGAKTLSAHVEVPPYYQKGDRGPQGPKGDRGADAYVNGYTTVYIDGEAVKQEGNVLTIDAYKKSSVDAMMTATRQKLGELETGKASIQDLAATAQNLGQGISQVGNIAGQAMVGVNALTQTKQDNLVAGENITIQGNVISAAGGGGGGMEYYTEDTTSGSAKIETPADITLKSHYAINLQTEGGSLSVGDNKLWYSGEAVAMERDLSIKADKLEVNQLALKIEEIEPFVVKYGETTYNEIVEAHNAGKECVMFDMVGTFPCEYHLNAILPTMLFFSCFEPSSNAMYWTRVASTNVWSRSSTAMEVTSRKVNSITSASTTSQYPSAKAVWDLVGNINTILDTI